jgi:hypothetical protein
MWLTVAAVSLVLGAVGWLVWWLVADGVAQRRKGKAAAAVARRYIETRDAMGKHDGHQGVTVSVVELLEQAARSGCGVRLNWTVEDTDVRGLVVVPEQDEWPTAVLPRMTDELMDAYEAATAASVVDELPARAAGAVPAPLEPVWVQRDEELLGRILGGLTQLGQDGMR